MSCCLNCQIFSSTTSVLFNWHFTTLLLCQAILRHSKHDGKQAKLQIQLEELEARERARQPSQQPLAEPTHPQPAVVAMHVPQHKMVVKASDVRVSNRACLSSMTIELNTPIFNDLIGSIVTFNFESSIHFNFWLWSLINLLFFLGEVDTEDISSLDQKLFMKNDISEVYQVGLNILSNMSFKTVS